MRRILSTEDGSTTLEDNRTGETYHSTFGAIAESEHIYINYGLVAWLAESQKPSLRLLEMGFGTGLNALLACKKADQENCSIEYHTYELYPLEKEEVEGLNFHFVEEESDRDLLYRLHNAPWEEPITITPYFTIYKHQGDFTQMTFPKGIDVLFFDAFSPNVQPELWTEEIFRSLFAVQNEGGNLTTYCAKGIVRRTLQSVGYLVERLAGPRGKREVLRATKIVDRIE